MSFIDSFAWIIRVVLASTAIAVFVAVGMAPEQCRRRSRNHPWAEAVEPGQAGEVTFKCGFVLWAGVDTGRSSMHHPWTRAVAMTVCQIKNYPLIFFWRSCRACPAAISCGKFRRFVLLLLLIESLYSSCEPIARWQHGTGRNIHRSRQGHPCYTTGHAANDRDR